MAPMTPGGRRSARVRWGLAALLTLAGVGAALTVRLADARAEVEEARAALLAGRASAAVPVFERYRGWPLVGSRAQSGLVLAHASLGMPETAPSSPDRDFPSDLSLLLDRAFGDGQVPAVRALGALGTPCATVYLAALALDGDDRDEAQARERLRADPAPFDRCGIGLEVRRTLALCAQGALTLVRDRVGRPVGHGDAEGRLVLEEGVEPAWIPRRVFEVLASPEERRPGLRLSLDLDLTHLAATALAGRHGSIVLVDPRTGAVLAAVSDPRTTAGTGTPAFEERREPASISKVITTAAALRAGIDPDAEISRMVCTGSERFEGGTLWCTHPAGHLQGLDHALAISCNVAFAKLGVMVGRERLLDELRRWGFDGSDLAGLGVGGRVVQPEGNERQLADLSIGLEATDTTPLHAALLAAVVGNRGRMPMPYLLDCSQGLLGLAPRPLDRAGEREVIDPSWLPLLSRAMGAVAEYGTAAGLAPPDFPVVMKTGTGATWHLGYHTNYIGLGPWPDPRFAFCVRITHEPSSGRVTRSARQVLGALLEGLAARQRRRLR